MSEPVPVRTNVSVDEYLAWERDQRDKHEYFDGRIFMMPGGSPRHNRLCSKVGSALEVQLGSKCSVQNADQRIRTKKDQYVYADVSVVCGEMTIEPGDVLTNPTIVVEVLSTSTEKFDRDDKWNGYRRNWSLTDYVLVSQRRPQIEHYRRDGNRWIYEIVDAGGVVTLSNGATLVVDDIFAGVFDLKGDEPDVPRDDE